MQIVRRIVLVVAAVVLVGTTPAFGQTKWDVTKTWHVGAEGSWDYLTVDSATHRMFVPRSTHTMVIDEATGKTLGDIPGQKIAHGVAIVPALGRGFITDGGGDGTIVIFDLKTYAVLGRLAALPDADGIIYDAKLNLILAVSGDKGVLMTFKPDIDPKSGKIDTPIALDGAPEFLVSDGTGAVFINLMDKGVVAKVDLTTKKVVARWPVAPGGQPVGMSMDAKTHRLFIGCRKPQLLIVMSADDGKVVASLPIGAGVDATKFDAGQVFASCRDGQLIVAAEVGGKYVVQQIVKTPQAARTMDIDPATHTIYMPTTEYEEVAVGAKPKAKVDGFMIVEVGRAM